MLLSLNQPLVVQDYFGPIEMKLDRAFAEIADAIERSAKIEEHPFFSLAKQNKQALILWASQEAIVTNPFSQVLFRVISSIKNVHIRSVLLPVVAGEHSVVRNGVAENSHPWLILRLCRSLGISDSDIKPTKAVIDFINVLESAMDEPMRALGILGVGNELMLLSEYRAIEACFDALFPEADYRNFLHANISEDQGHTHVIELAAAALTTFGLAPDDFKEGAQLGVVARVAYYDALLGEVL